MHYPQVNALTTAFLQNQYQFFPNDIHTLSREKIMGINRLITKWKCFDLLSNSLNLFFKEMYSIETSLENLYVNIGD